jgi:copper(I)-binding protein
MLRTITAAAAALLLVTAATAQDIVVGDLTISAPFTRATLPNAPVAGGFLTIANAGSGDDRLIAATSSVAAEVQIHEMSMEGDVMRMRALPDGLVVPAGATVELTPGGYHLMFLTPNAPFALGTTVPVTLTFAEAGEVQVELPVLDAAAATAAMPHAH